MSRSTVTLAAPSANVPTTTRRRLGQLSIEASQIGDRACFVAEGPPDAIAALAIGLQKAGLYVETYAEDPLTLYAQGPCDAHAVECDFDEEETTMPYARKSLDSDGLMAAVGGASC